MRGSGAEAGTGDERPAEQRTKRCWLTGERLYESFEVDRNLGRSLRHLRGAVRHGVPRDGSALLRGSRNPDAGHHHDG